jgi:hypothetical protein
VVTSSLYSGTCCTPILSQPNGDYLFAQTVGNGFQRTAGKICRFNETGVVDSSFSSMKFTFGNQQRNEPTTMALQSNGQIAVGGLFWLGKAQFRRRAGYRFWRRLTCYLRDCRRADPEEWQDRRRRKSSKQPNGHHDPNAGAYLAK